MLKTASDSTLPYPVDKKGIRKTYEFVSVSGQPNAKTTDLLLVFAIDIEIC